MHEANDNAKHRPILAPCALLAIFGTLSPLLALDLKDAVIFAPEPGKPAVRVLVEEAYKRTQIRLPVTSAWPAQGTTVIAVVTGAPASLPAEASSVLPPVYVSE